MIGIILGTALYVICLVVMMIHQTIDIHAGNKLATIASVTLLVLFGVALISILVIGIL